MNLVNIFDGDAFSMSELTTFINSVAHVPGRAGELVFSKLPEDEAKGVPTVGVSIERQGESLNLIPTSARGAPAPKERADKRSLRNFNIPQIKLEDTIHASEIQNVREIGGVESLDPLSPVQRQLEKMAKRHDLTLENHRLGALTGIIRDADGSVLLNLFEAFDVLNSDGLPAPETINFELDDFTTPSFSNAVRVKCQKLARYMARRAKLPTDKAMVWAFCGDEFFDMLVSNPSVKATYDGIEAAKRALGENYAFGIFEFGGIIFENYRGSDDGQGDDPHAVVTPTVGIAPDECRFFFTGDVRGLYGEYFAPADFMETVNTDGLRRYAKMAMDPRFNQFVDLHTQQNPLPLCLRPQTLVRGVATEE